MVKLEEVLNHDKIRFIVENEEYKYLLYWLKENDCLWRDGRIIQPEVNEPDKTTKTLVVTKDKLIYHPHGYISSMSLDNKPKYYFKDISNDIVKDINFEDKVKLRQSIEDKEKLIELEKAIFEERLKHQREINQRQLKYQKYTKTLPKQFFVKYKDTDELVELYYVLQLYGYENYFNINPIHYEDKPNVLHVDNRGMHFSPTNVTCCACAVTAGIKFYTYEQFVPMFKRIFEEPTN